MQRNAQRLKVFIKDAREGLQSCVRFAMLYGSEAWWLRVKEMAVLRRSERALIRAIMWCEAIRSKKQQAVDEHVRHKGVFR